MHVQYACKELCEAGKLSFDILRRNCLNYVQPPNVKWCRMQRNGKVIIPAICGGGENQLYGFQQAWVLFLLSLPEKVTQAELSASD